MKCADPAACPLGATASLKCGLRGSVLRWPKFCLASPDKITSETGINFYLLLVILVFPFFLNPRAPKILITNRWPTALTKKMYVFLSKTQLYGDTQKGFHFIIQIIQ